MLAGCNKSLIPGLFYGGPTPKPLIKTQATCHQSPSNIKKNQVQLLELRNILKYSVPFSIRTRLKAGIPGMKRTWKTLSKKQMPVDRIKQLNLSNACRPQNPHTKALIYQIFSTSSRHSISIHTIDSNLSKLADHLGPMLSMNQKVLFVGIVLKGLKGLLLKGCSIKPIPRNVLKSKNLHNNKN